jgi:Fic family protein
MRFMWIWQSKAWPNFEVDARVLQPALASARVAQGRMLGLASSLKLVDLGALQLNGWAEEAISTAQIEGEVLQLHSVRASAARRLGIEGASRAKRDARTEATLDILQAAVQDWDQALKPDALLGWHAALFPTGRSGLSRLTPGAWRTHAEPMQIVTPRLGKPDVVHYEAPASNVVPAEMKALLAWFEAHRIKPQMDGLVRSALAHLWFEVVHPFEDGNGRIGRALSELALAQDMRSSQRLFSLSHQMMQDRAGYYAQLHAASAQGRMDVTAWVLWFVHLVEKACLASLGHMQSASAKTQYWAALNEEHPHLTASQKKVLNKLYDAGPGGYSGGMSTEKYVAVSGVSRATAYRELTALVDAGLLLRLGQGRGTRYEVALAR